VSVHCRFVGIPDGDTLSARIGQCLSRCGISPSKLDEAYQKAGITKTQERTILLAKTVKDLTPEITRKLTKIVDRLSKRSGASTTYIWLGWLAGESRVPDWVKEISN